MGTPEMTLSASDGSYRIIHSVHGMISHERAKGLYESGEAGEMNISMCRLIEMDWDVDALKEYYATAA